MPPTTDDELAVAHEAVDRAVGVLGDARTAEKPLDRIAKQAKDFATEVDLASEAVLREFLAARTPSIGFFGEEGGGDALDRGAVWVADPLDGTINFATGSPLCGVMLALLRDGEPVVAVIDLPFLGVRVDARAGAGARIDGRPTSAADVPALADGVVAMGDAFHRGGPRQSAYLGMTAAVHAAALRFRCVGSAAVLWCWLAGGQLQGVVLAHNNPYDVVAGHLVAREAGAVVSDYAGRPLGLDSAGVFACVPGIRDELLALGTDLARAAA